jgi:hypothetical protein
MTFLPKLQALELVDDSRSNALSRNRFLRRNSTLQKSVRQTPESTPKHSPDNGYSGQWIDASESEAAQTADPTAAQSRNPFRELQESQ